MIDQERIQELDAIIDMVKAFTPEFYALHELQANLAPQPQPEWLEPEPDFWGDFQEDTRWVA
jgi:hypothetical protein